VVIVPTLHPGFLLRAGDEGFAKLEAVVRSDFEKARRLISAPKEWDERPIWETDSVGRLRWLYPTIDDVAEFVGPIHRYALEGRDPVLTFDVETSGEHQLDCKLLCVGMGYVDLDATVSAGRPVRRVCNVPLLQPGGAPYWASHDEWVIREYLKGLLSNPYITKSAHNGSFDTVVMWAQGIPVHGWREDTMQLHHCIDSELPHNLGFVGSRYTDGRYWKDDVKGGLGWLHMDATRLRSYNLRDVLVTNDIRVPMLAEAERLGVVETYREEVRVAQVMARATIRGVAVDLERRDSTQVDDKGKFVGLAPQLRKQMDDSLAALRDIAGPTFDPGKPAQLRWLLFDKLGFPVAKETKSGLPATDKEAFMLLDALADTDEQKQTLKSVTKWRQAQKFISTFVNGLEVLRDGRFHPSWKLLTSTGRFASSPNFQNLPGRIKKIFRAAPGYKLVGIDLSQAELRLIAYYANEKSLLEMYANDINVHTVNASMLFKVQCPPEAADNINPQTEAYLRRAVVEQLGMAPGSYDAFPVVPKAKWKPVRTLAKNYEFGCWLKTTKVAVLDGRRAVEIQDIKPGDMTWCWDGEKYVPTRIKQAWSTGVKQCVRLVVKSSSGKRKVLECTPDHRILTRDGTMRAAADLKPGDRLMPFRRWGGGRGSYALIDPRNDGGRAAEHRWVMGATEVVSVEIGVVGEVWDLEVEHPSHNFALEDGGVFVSNSAYGAIEETLYSVLRSKRDPDSNELLFPSITLSEVQGLRVVWKRLRPGVLSFWEKICRATERHGMYVCPISGRVRRFRGGFKRNEMLNCLDDETEALTKRGWVRGFELRRDDTLLTKNAESGRLEWQRMTDLRLFPDHEGPLVEFKTKSFTAVSTPDHRWLVHDRKTGTNVCRVTSTIDPNGMDGIHRTGEDYQPAGRCTLSDDFIELIGWALTDGCFEALARKRTGPRFAVTLMQSRFGNPDMVRRIDGLVDRLKLKVWRSSGDSRRRGCERWTLDRKTSAFLMDLFPGRRLTHEFIASLSRPQARHLVFVMVLGDGTLGAKTTFTASSREKAELFQMLCVVAGYATSVVERRQKRPALSPKVQPGGIVSTKPHYIVTILRRDRVQVLKKHRREFVGKVPVWCPIVPNTYFVARRGGHVFITGNTPIQMGVASHMNKAMLIIQDIYDRETGGAAQVVQQVHDALTVEAPDEYAKRAGEVMLEVLSRDFAIHPVPGLDEAIPHWSSARLPADPALINDYLDKT
jgi:DNA polymerase I-like protein with 3'-5' exonuclease and polymerase domains